MEHTATPWKIDVDFDWVRDSEGRIVANCTGRSDQRANAAFIVRACNSFGLLLEALRSIMSVSAPGREQYTIAKEAIREAEKEIVS